MTHARQSTKAQPSTRQHQEAHSKETRESKDILFLSMVQVKDDGTDHASIVC